MSSYENLSPQVITRIAREIQELARKPAPGIQLLQEHSESIAEIHAEIDGPEDTPYVGGTFHVKLVLSQDFPNSPPRGFFLTKIYHPNVGPTGDICVNTLKKDWTATVTLSHVLQVIRCLLIVPFPESSLNDEAGKQFMESYDDYARRARLLTSVHAMRKASASTMAMAGEKGAAASAGEGKEAAGEKDGDAEGDEKAGGGGGVLGSPNVAGLAKRKAGGGAANANGGAKDAAAGKRNNKKRGLKRL